MNIIDSSSIVKFFSAEPGWEALRKYMNSPVTIELAVKELGNAMWKKSMSGQFDADSAKEVLVEFQRIAKLLDQRVYMNNAFEIAVEHNITIYDSLFIAAAFIEKCELITSDRKQADISEKYGIRALIV